MRIRTSDARRHLILLTGIVLLNLPLLLAIMTISHSGSTLSQYGLQLSWGGNFVENVGRMLFSKSGFSGAITAWSMLYNSFVTGAGFAIATTLLSFLAAYALTYFRLATAGPIFAVLMATMMLPLEMRILPTYQVAVDLGLYNTYTGIVLPLVASAIAVFYFRQFFRSVPDEILEAAMIDGAGPIKFLTTVLVPMSLQVIATIFTIMFITGWNQYLWPLIITSDEEYFTLVRGMTFVGRTSISGLVLIVLALLPPACLVILCRKLLIKGLFDGGH